MPIEAERFRQAVADRYSIEREIGHGGMATVYLAEDLKHHRKVALKVLRPDLASVLGPARFLREIEIEANLQHTNILPLHDSGEAEGFLYYVMPYVEGESLRDRLEREPQLPLKEALRITHEVADALAHAHERGIVHRDVKPENILLSEGHAVLADFGIARAVTEAGGERVTETGIAVGTPQYMSPEQAAGESTLDKRSDLYSLGCVLYEMLAGEPVFTGRTRQAVILKQISEPPPSLEVVRPNLPYEVTQAIDTVLAKVPADRFATTGEFVAALEGAKRKRRRVHPRPWVKVAVPVAVLLMAALVVWRIFWPTDQELDRNKVIVFPLIDARAGLAAAQAGWEVAIAIGAKLEHTDPLKWIDGWRHLDESIRQDPQRLRPRTCVEISQERGARYYIDGVISVVGGALNVALQLHDAQGDSLVARETSVAEVGQANVALLGLEAITRLLPRLVPPGHDVDAAALSRQDIGALTLWLKGEQEYRQARFLTALAFYERAVQLDSTFAFAAVTGAHAANWKNKEEQAARLIDLAVAHDSVLPPKYLYLAHGFRHYLHGRADSAVANLKLAVAADPESSETATMLAEAYYHLFPSEPFLDTLAAHWFNVALQSDTTFLVPLVHLAEFALNRGDLEEAEQYVNRLASVDPDVDQLGRLKLALACRPSTPVCWDWEDSTSAEFFAHLTGAAKVLSMAGGQLSLAEQGFSRVLHSEGASTEFKWGALQGLQGVLVAEGRYGEALAPLDSAFSLIPAYGILTVFDAIVGHVSNDSLTKVIEPAAERFSQVAHQAAGEHYESGRSLTLWLMGAWHAHRGELEDADSILVILEARARETGSREDRLLSAALAPHVILAHGDTTLAIQRLRDLKPTAPRLDLEYEVAEPLALERLLLAELLLARGEYREAHEVATVFDHPAAIMFLPCLRASLVVRYRAAQALGDALAGRYRQRLWDLGMTDLE